MTSTTNNEPRDVEAPTVGGIVLGADTNNEEDAQKMADSSQAPSAFDTTIVVTTLLYTVMVVALFAGPLLASDTNESSGGWDGLLRGLSIIFAVGVAALIIATISLVSTIRRWNQLHAMSKAMGVFPTVVTIGIIIVLAVLVSIQSDNSDTTSNPVEPDCSFNSTDCKTSTGSF